MKKAMIIITAVIYLVAVVVVAFLGYQAEAHSVPVPVEDIALCYETYPFQFIDNGALIYEITENKQVDPTSDNPKLSTNYCLTIYEYEYFFNTTDHVIKVRAHGISSKGDPQNPDVTYYVHDKELVNINSDGDLVFITNEPYHSTMLDMSAQDTSGIKKSMYITWH